MRGARLRKARSMDSVAVAFELMALELNAAVEDLNSAGARLFQGSEYDEAKRLTEKGKALKEFCDRVTVLSKEWSERFATPPEGSDDADDDDATARTILSASKSPKTGLLVRFPDGTIVAEPKAATTLVKAIKKIGFERVAALEVLVNKENIVSLQPSRRYHDTYVAPYYVKTHSSTEQKKKTLERISDELGLGLLVSILL